MASLAQALALAARGFHVFPLQPNSKLPLIKAWQDKATTDAEQISKWWHDPVLGLEEDWNIGICTSRFGADESLLAVDIDNKGSKNGDEEILRLELAGDCFPYSGEHSTPTGGRHILYRLRGREVPNSAGKIAPGVDIRGRGGFVVGPGSSIDGKPYTGNDAEVAVAPDWLVARCNAGATQPAEPRPVATEIDQDRAVKRAIDYLATAPAAYEGEGGDQLTFTVAARLKDIGVEMDVAMDLLLDHWNERCEPPWSPEELSLKVSNAYRYGVNPPGVDAPESQFDPVQIDDPIGDLQGTPVEKMNREYAFIKRGAYILGEYTDHHGRFGTEHYTSHQLNLIYANKQMMNGKSSKPISQVWLEWTGRREYDGLVFAPLLEIPNQYNLWRGFRVQPAAPFTERERHESVNMFIEHALHNICGSDPRLFDWLMCYFAHLIQRPWEKPLVATVFRGNKGTGKNALVERIGHLLGHHFMVADDDRYLVGNFNSHLETCLFLVLDEAAWAGNKKAEGRLKGLITGTEHTIERKGYEPYKVDNLTRVAIIGNEDWLVPAGEDERRWAVFNVGDGRKQDRKFFHDMRVGMEQGGYSHLLRYLMDYKITQDINHAPNTAGLVDQKLASLGPFEEYWLGCLTEETILGVEVEGWPESVQKTRFRDGYKRWADRRNIRSRLLDERAIGHKLKKMAPSVAERRPSVDGIRVKQYALPPIAELRVEFEAYVKGPVPWQ